MNLKNNSEVKIIQRFDINNIPSIDNNQLVREFRVHLADIDIRKRKIIENNKKRERISRDQYNSTEMQYEWIEKLLQTPIEDGRKYALWKILCPYLVNVKKFGYEESFEILKIWLEKCNNLLRLDFNPNIEIKVKLSCVKHYNPISIKTFMNNNKKSYLQIRTKVTTLT